MTLRAWGAARLTVFLKLLRADRREGLNAGRALVDRERAIALVLLLLTFADCRAFGAAEDF